MTVMELIAGAGHPDGFPLTIITVHSADEETKKLVEAITKSLSQAGIDVNQSYYRGIEDVSNKDFSLIVKLVPVP